MKNYPNTTLKNLLLASIIMAMSITGAIAADALSINLTAKQVITQNGQTTYKAITKANTGDIVQYSASYRNNIDKPMTDVSINLPVPANMVYTGTASPAPTFASLDGKKFEPIPLKRMVNGKLVEVPVNEYRAVRWVVKYLPAQKSANVTMNARVR